MPTLAVAHLRTVSLGPEIVEYLRRIDDTLTAFGGKFLIHGAQAKPIEGDFSGDIVIIAFPNRKRAEDWYASPAYQAILPLRTQNSDGVVILVDTVSPGHRATDIVAALAALAAPCP